MEASKHRGAGGAGGKRSQSRQKMHGEKTGGGGAQIYGTMNPDDSGSDETDLTDDIVTDSEPPISMGGSSDEDILEESSDESDEELAVGTGGAAGRGKPTF